MIRVIWKTNLIASVEVPKIFYHIKRNAFQAGGYATDLLIVKTHLMKWIVFAPTITFSVVDAVKAVHVMEKYGLICMNAFHSNYMTVENRLVISVTNRRSKNIFAFLC